MKDIKWGPAIDVGRRRPNWLIPGEPVMVANHFGDWLEEYYNYTGDNTNWSWDNIPLIKLPEDHPQYKILLSPWTEKKDIQSILDEFRK